MQRASFGVLQFLEMEGERRGGQPKPFTDLTGGQAVRPRLHQKAEDIKPRFLGESAQSGNGLRSLHISNIVEISGSVKPPRRKAEKIYASSYSRILSISRVAPSRTAISTSAPARA